MRDTALFATSSHSFLHHHLDILEMNMNPKHLPLLRTITALAIFATAGTVLANDIYYPDEGPGQTSSGMPGKTREEVRDELTHAYQQGLLNRNDEVDYPPLPAFRSSRSREEVHNEAIQAAHNNKFNSDYDGR